jgi:hypothetical protein
MKSAVKKVRNSRKKVERRLATQKARPAVGNVVNLMDALRASIGQEQASKPARKSKKATGQKEMLLPIDGKKPAKEAAPKKIGRESAAQVSLGVPKGCVARPAAVAPAAKPVVACKTRGVPKGCVMR